jgi:Holliday junction resolvasome RuvABC endonuclease subunit
MIDVLALDLSLTSTGVAFPDGTHTTWQPKTRRGCERMAWLLDELCAWLDRNAPDVVVLEGFAYAAKGRSTHEIGGLGWVVRMALHDRGIAWVEVPPSSLKKYATGRGNAGKPEMQAAAAKRLGHTPDRPDDNVIDALFLRAMALDAYGWPECVMPADQVAALGKVDWPSLAEVAA